MRKAYARPELIRRGDIAAVTQGWGSLGSGDIIFQAFTDANLPTTWGKFSFTDGCTPNTQFLCTGSLTL